MQWLAHGLMNSAARVQRRSEAVTTLHHCSTERDLSRVHSQNEREGKQGESPAQMFFIPQKGNLNPTSVPS